jgi:hypothetical protein
MAAIGLLPSSVPASTTGSGGALAGNVKLGKTRSQVSVGAKCFLKKVIQ